MVDFSLFRSRTFLGANMVGFIVSFAMLAMFFFIALYMQNILGYSAVEAGVRFLPSTLMIVLIAPLAGRLADRIGPRPPMVAGLTLTTVALFLQTRIDLHTGYGLLLPAFVLMGIGMALVMSPMSTAAMNAVPPAEGGRGLRDPLDEPHGRRHVRRGGARRAVPAPRPQRHRETRSRAPASAPPSRSGSSRGSARRPTAAACRPRPLRRRTTPSSTRSRAACGCRPAWRRSAW